MPTSVVNSSQKHWRFPTIERHQLLRRSLENTEETFNTRIFYKKQLIRNSRLNFSKVKKQPYQNLKAKKLLQFAVLIPSRSKQRR